MRSPSRIWTARLAGLCVVAAWVSLGQGQAEAYPQWQFTTGATRCNQCHYGPAGGGLPTGYGRDAVADEIATWEGDGSFMHGAVELPEWIALGLDLRGAYVRHDPGGPDAPTQALFPMQTDGHLRLKFGDFSFMGIGGFRGRARDVDAAIPAGSFQPANSSRFVSREHWVMWMPETRGLYARAGRFFAPYGLRFAEHVITTRRDTRLNTLQETYNLSAGYLENEWEAHLTLIGPDFLQYGNQDMGAAAYYERRLLDETLAVGGQAKFVLNGDEGIKRGFVGAIAKYYVEPAKMLVMAECNGIMAMPDAGDSSIGLSGLFGVAVLPLRGITLTALYERLQTDIKVKDTDTNAATGLLSWFPYPHFEIQLVGRYVMPAGQGAVPTFLAQLHYYL